MQRYGAVGHVCLAILFVELLLIRWISTEMSIFAYLQNSVLIACFLGLGMGLIESRPQDRLTRLLPPLACLTTILFIPQIRTFAREASSVLGSFHDFTIWNSREAERWEVVGALLMTMLVLGCCWAIMVQFGAELSRLLGRCENRLTAYSFDMLGSLSGVWLFTLMAYFSLPPQMWFVVLCVLLFSFPAFRTRQGCLGCLLLLTLACWNAAASYKVRTTWTPYQKLQFRPLKGDEWEVFVNNTGFQQIQNDAQESALPREQRPVHQYNLPGRMAGSPVRSLVVGAGTGNDVAGLLRNSEASIEAVDIDPVLLEFGRLLHPEKPYSNPRVHITVNDARATFQSLEPGSLDLIVFGLLDSHTTPNLSNARLDNFVYTEESLRTAARLLRPSGVLVLLFQAQRDYIGSRLNNTLETVFGVRPLVFRVPPSEWGWGGLALVTGSPETIQASLRRDPMLDRFIQDNLCQPADPNVRSTSDSWPYLYIEKPSIPSLFWILGLIFLVLWVISSRLRYGKILGPNWSNPQELFMTLLGISFSLVQVFSICKASILFGSTWLVNSVVISGILVMILAANILLPRVTISRFWITLALSLGCIGLAFLPLSKLLLLPFLPRFLLAATLSGLPMLLSGLLFGHAFAKTQQPGRDLGANLFGAMLGGALQLVTFKWGIPSLMVLAGVIYASTLLISLPSNRSVSEELSSS
ncbi:class I SAM-dependent methyltransferase [bacterium]|nr:class I SAM-dependent methyltransferase [bacterium]